MVRTITRREYLVVCDGCGESSPAAQTLEQAYRLARDQEWDAILPVRGFDFLTTWLCPSCQLQREQCPGDASRSDSLETR